MRLHEKEHPEVKVPAELYDYLMSLGWKDISWHNDTTVSLQLRKFRLWIYHDDPEQREFDDVKRFVLSRYEDDDVIEFVEDILSTDLISEVLDVIKQRGLEA